MFKAGNIIYIYSGIEIYKFMFEYLFEDKRMK